MEQAEAKRFRERCQGWLRRENNGPDKRQNMGDCFTSRCLKGYPNPFPVWNFGSSRGNLRRTQGTLSGT